MYHIKEYIKAKEAEGLKHKQIAEGLPIGNAMIGQYKNHGFLPSMEVAMAMFKKEGIVLHPYAQESIEFEINRGVI